MRNHLRLVCAVALVLAGVLVTPEPAAATPGHASAIFTGTGSISPGLNVTPVPNPQTFSMSGQMTGVFGVGTTAAAGTLNCTFSGDDLIGSPAAGTGNMTGNCSGTGVVGTSGSATVSISASGTYSRAGCCITVIYNFQICVTTPLGTVCGWGSGKWTICLFYGSAPPVKTFTAVGEFEGVAL